MLENKRFCFKESASFNIVLIRSLESETCRLNFDVILILVTDLPINKNSC